MSDNEITDIMTSRQFKGILRLFLHSLICKSLHNFLLRSARRLLAMAERIVAPLRKIISRELDVYQPNPKLKYFIYSLLDTLECGHIKEIYLFDGLRDLLNAYTQNPAIAARRHHCRSCASLLAKKKPASVPLSAVANKGVA